MSAVDTVETLLSLGMTVKDAYATASASGTTDWSAFMNGPDFAKIQGEVSGLLTKLGPDDVSSALAAVQTKKKALLAGQPVSALSSDELTQYFALLGAEGVLVAQELKSATPTAAFMQWLVTSALPTLAAIAKIVVPILL